MSRHSSTPALAYLTVFLLLAGCGDRTAVPDLDDAGPHRDSSPSDAASIDWIGGSCPHPQVIASCKGGWCTIPAGCFWMGSPSDEKCRGLGETRHVVTLTRSFEIAATETTLRQFSDLLGYNPSHFASCGLDCPVEHLTWHEATAYCNALSKPAGLEPCYQCFGTGAGKMCELASSTNHPYDCEGYRLPTEAEWEYAARAGTRTALYSGSIDGCQQSSTADRVAWYSQNAAGSPHPVGLKQPNAWGLFDMHGNVAEHTADVYKEDLGAVPAVDPDKPPPRWTPLPQTMATRGGSFQSPVSQLRSARRAGVDSRTPAQTLGFRCARTR